MGEALQGGPAGRTAGGLRDAADAPLRGLPPGCPSGHPGIRRPGRESRRRIVQHASCGPLDEGHAGPNSEIASGVFGYSHTTGGYDSKQAEFVRVSFADVGPMPIPDMNDEDVLYLSDVFPTGYQGAEMGGITGGET